jgi:phospholipid/cholesterol/gamma-HCH transport system permease protein
LKTKESPTPNAGTLHAETGEHGCRLFIQGEWLLVHYSHLKTLAVDINTYPAPVTLDFTRLSALDTSGARCLVGLLGRTQLETLLPGAQGLSDERVALLKTVNSAFSPELPLSIAATSRLDAVARLGDLIDYGWQHFLLLSGFIGLSLATLLRVALRPARWRLTSLVAHIHQTGLNAVPIVALLTFLVGAVVAFLGATVLKNFGASIYTVDLVAYSFLREFGVLLTAILLAGRTASAFTAQLGSMKVNEEIDALRTLGLDPMEVLVIPRLLALLIVLPLLTFVAMLSGLVGGAVVALLSLDISLTRYIAIVRDVPVEHFWVGISKAPVFAFLIALIGCLEGFKVAGSAQSVGEHTTSSVVQSIFVVILLDAVAALFFMEMGW